MVEPAEPVDPAQTPAALKEASDRYLIEQAVKAALRAIYGDRAVDQTRRIAHDLSRELVLRGVTIRG